MTPIAIANRKSRFITSLVEVIATSYLHLEVYALTSAWAFTWDWGTQYHYRYNGRLLSQSAAGIYTDFRDTHLKQFSISWPTSVPFRLGARRRIEQLWCTLIEFNLPGVFVGTMFSAWSYKTNRYHGDDGAELSEDYPPASRLWIYYRRRTRF